MHKHLTTLLCIALVLLAAPASAEVEVRSITRSFEVASGEEILLDFPLGDVVVTAGDPGQVEIKIVVTCSNSSRRCRERAEQIRLDDTHRGGRLHLEIEGYSNRLTSRPSVEAILSIPATSTLTAEIGVGSMRVEDLAGDINIDLGVGDVTVFADPAQIGSIRLEVGIGAAEIQPQPRDQWSSGFLFLGNEIYWEEGDGEGRIIIDVGVGEALVRMN
jgi:hypothetical protein